MTPKDFISALAPAAQACQKAHKIPASFTIAQAALESGWGAHAPGFNLFGIKADPSWHGASVDLPTHEVVNGKSVPIVAKFRAYPDWAGSINDHAQFLLNNKRYCPAFECTSGPSFAQAVAKAGYSTSPTYAQQITQLIDEHELQLLDA